MTPEIYPADDQDPAEFFRDLLALAGDPGRVQVLTNRARASAAVDEETYARWLARQGSTADPAAPADVGTPPAPDPEDGTDTTSSATTRKRRK